MAYLLSPPSHSAIHADQPLMSLCPSSMSIPLWETGRKMNGLMSTRQGLELKAGKSEELTLAKLPPGAKGDQAMERNPQGLAHLPLPVAPWPAPASSAGGTSEQGWDGPTPTTLRPFIRQDFSAPSLCSGPSDNFSWTPQGNWKLKISWSEKHRDKPVQDL